MRRTNSSLALLAARQENLRHQLQLVERDIARDYAELISPSASSSKGGVFMQTASRAWWLVDGVLTGYKVMRRMKGVANLFSSKKRK